MAASRRFREREYQMAEPFLGEIRLAGFGIIPRGWTQCNGQTLSIAQNQALFSLLGTTYGGNGVTTFQLPNLQARIPMHTSNSGSFTLGAVGGETTHTLTLLETPRTPTKRWPATPPATTRARPVAPGASNPLRSAIRRRSPAW